MKILRLLFVTVNEKQRELLVNRFLPSFPPHIAHIYFLYHSKQELRPYIDFAVTQRPLPPIAFIGSYSHTSLIRRYSHTA